MWKSNLWFISKLWVRHTVVAESDFVDVGATVEDIEMVVVAAKFVVCCISSCFGVRQSCG